MSSGQRHGFKLTFGATAVHTGSVCRSVTALGAHLPEEPTSEGRERDLETHPRGLTGRESVLPGGGANGGRPVGVSRASSCAR